MRAWLNVERRFLGTLMETIAPSAKLGPMDGDPHFWTELDRSAPPLLHAALRVASWTLGSWLGLLSPSRRVQVLEALAVSRFYLVRQLMQSVKLVVCFARFAETTRERSR